MIKVSYDQERGAWIRLATEQEVSKAKRGYQPLDCYKYETGTGERGCAVGGVMPHICTHCPWESWSRCDPLPATNPEFVRTKGRAKVA